MSEVDLDDMSTDATQKQMNDNFSVLTEDDLPEADRSLMTVRFLRRCIMFTKSFSRSLQRARQYSIA